MIRLWKPLSPEEARRWASEALQQEHERGEPAFETYRAGCTLGAASRAEAQRRDVRLLSSRSPPRRQPLSTSAVGARDGIRAALLRRRPRHPTATVPPPHCAGVGVAAPARTGVGARRTGAAPQECQRLHLALCAAVSPAATLRAPMHRSSHGHVVITTFAGRPCGTAPMRGSAESVALLSDSRLFTPPSHSLPPVRSTGVCAADDRCAARDPHRTPPAPRPPRRTTCRPPSSPVWPDGALSTPVPAAAAPGARDRPRRGHPTPPVAHRRSPPPRARCRCRAG
eukprot:ctg_70.g27